jgi:hypothetical protein
LSYRWRQVKGPKVELIDADTVSPSFTSPQSLKKAKPVKLVFRLIVSDGRKKSSTDKVAITLASQPCQEPLQLQDGQCITATPAFTLNDSGRANCVIGDGSGRSLPCPVEGYPGQDAEFGRDLTDNDDSDGHAGFSFTKIGAKGETLDQSAESWNCVKDNITGLMWEVKTADSGLHDFRNTYSWYQRGAAINGGNAGKKNGGRCQGSACDTLAYQQAVNAEGLCGAGDWRLPTVTELISIVDYGKLDPAIDKKFFPHTAIVVNDMESALKNQYAYDYWTSVPAADDSSYAFMVEFGGGGSYGELKSEAIKIRLVRNGQ